MYEATSTNNEPRKGYWQQFANCRGVDPELFFPERGDDSRAAKEICKMCVVRGECLDFALQNNEHYGIWGGLNERERRRVRRTRNAYRRAVIGD